MNDKEIIELIKINLQDSKEMMEGRKYDTKYEYYKGKFDAFKFCLSLLTKVR